MTAGEWFWGGFYLGFGVLASSLIVVGGFSIIMAIIEHVSDERANKKFKEDQEKRRQEEFEASYRRYIREHPEASDAWKEDCKDGYFEEGE